MFIIIFSFSNRLRNLLVYICHGQVAVTETTSPFYYRRLSHIYLRIIYGGQAPGPLSFLLISCCTCVVTRPADNTLLLAARLVMTIVTLSTPSWTLHHLLRPVILCNISCCLHHTLESLQCNFTNKLHLLWLSPKCYEFRLAFQLTVEPNIKLKYEPTNALGPTVINSFSSAPRQHSFVSAQQNEARI